MRRRRYNFESTYCRLVRSSDDDAVAEKTTNLSATAKSSSSSSLLFIVQNCTATALFVSFVAHGGGGGGGCGGCGTDEVDKDSIAATRTQTTVTHSLTQSVNDGEEEKGGVD